MAAHVRSPPPHQRLATTCGRPPILLFPLRSPIHFILCSVQSPASFASNTRSFISAALSNVDSHRQLVTSIQDMSSRGGKLAPEVNRCVTPPVSPFSARPATVTWPIRTPAISVLHVKERHGRVSAGSRHTTLPCKSCAMTRTSLHE